MDFTRRMNWEASAEFFPPWPSLPGPVCSHRKAKNTQFNLDHPLKTVFQVLKKQGPDQV